MEFFGGAMMNGYWELIWDKNATLTDKIECAVLCMFGAALVIYGTALVWYLSFNEHVISTDVYDHEPWGGLAMMASLLVALVSAILYRTMGNSKNPQPKFAVPLYRWING
ncbi:MAG: hypothetical protein Q7R47_00510 [Candidatus Diapherotrites archaeon]|nr:hypothetical protein [Candidatus Diapherotrites archaeon]